MEDTGGKSGRRPGRHLQVEASGPGNARPAHGGLRVDSGESLRRKVAARGPGSKLDAPEASSGPVWEIQEVSRVGAQGVTSKSKPAGLAFPGPGLNRCSVETGMWLTAAGEFETRRVEELLFDRYHTREGNGVVWDLSRLFHDLAAISPSPSSPQLRPWPSPSPAPPSPSSPAPPSPSCHSSPPARGSPTGCSPGCAGRSRSG